MGTRVDFYVGKGLSAKWIGSIGNDGFRPSKGGAQGVGLALINAKTETKFRSAIRKLMDKFSDHVPAEKGWPWPWDDSSITDCSYWFFDNQVWDVHCKFEPCGPVWVPCSDPEPNGDTGERYESVVYPNMSAIRNVRGGWRPIL